MAITGTAIADGGITNAGNGATTGTITFNPGKFYVFGVGAAPGFGTSVTISGLGLTWTKYVTENNDTIIWYGTGTPVSDVITFAKTGTHSLVWCADEFTQVNPSNPFVQEVAAFNGAGTTITATLASALKANNAVYGFVRRATAAQADPAPRSGLTELGTDSAVFTGQSDYSVDGANNAAWTGLSAGANAWLGIAIEMQFGVPGGGGGGGKGGGGGGNGGGGKGPPGGGGGGGGPPQQNRGLIGQQHRRRRGLLRLGVQ